GCPRRPRLAGKTPRAYPAGHERSRIPPASPRAERGHPHPGDAAGAGRPGPDAPPAPGENLPSPPMCRASGRCPAPGRHRPRNRPPMTETRILCIGAMLWDVIGRAARVMAHGADVPGRIRHIPGGVALNVALAMARQGLAPVILSAVARDAEGEALTAAAMAGGVDCRWLARDTGQPTDTYMAIEDPD